MSHPHANIPEAALRLMPKLVGADEKKRVTPHVVSFDGHDQLKLERIYNALVDERLKAGLKIHGFTPFPYRLSFFKDGRDFGIQEDGQEGERNFYRTHAAADAAARRFISTHGYPQKMVLMLKRTLAKFLPVWVVTSVLKRDHLSLEEEAKILVLALKPSPLKIT